MSPEAFSRAAFNAGHGYVSSKTIYRIVGKGIVPGVRVRGVIALQMGRSSRSIWRNAPIVSDLRVAA